MAYKEEKQLELLMGVYREMKKLESHTKDPVIKEVVNDSDNNYSDVLENLEEAMKEVLLRQYIAAELEKGDD